MIAEAVLFPELEGPEFVPSDEVERVAGDVLRRHANQAGSLSVPMLVPLEEAVRGEELRIAYLLNTKDFDPLTEEATHDAIAKCIKAPKLWHDVTGIDVVIWVRAYFWNLFDARKRAAVALHELLHVGVDHDQDGKIKVKVRKHDVEDFVAVMRFYGPLDAPREHFARVWSLWKDDGGEPPAQPASITPIRPSEPG